MKLINQRGVTLIELLAAIVIVGFLGVLIWRFFFQTIDYNSYAVTEQTLQSEANVILAKLQSEHTKNTIISLTGGDTLVAILADGTDEEISTGRSNIEYVLLPNDPVDISNPLSSASVSTVFSTPTTTSNRLELEVHLVLTTTYKEGRPLYFILNTKLSKLSAN